MSCSDQHFTLANKNNSQLAGSALKSGANNVKCTNKDLRSETNKLERPIIPHLLAPQSPHPLPRALKAKSDHPVSTTASNSVTSRLQPVSAFAHRRWLLKAERRTEVSPKILEFRGVW
jgi:hypothetical protein